MKYTEWLIPELKALESQRASLSSIKERRAILETQRTGIRSANLDKMPSPTGGNPREEMLINNLAEDMELARKYDIVEADVKRLDTALADLSAMERGVLDLFYMHRSPRAVDILMKETGREKTTVYRMKDAAVLRLAIRLYGIAESM